MNFVFTPSKTVTPGERDVVAFVEKAGKRIEVGHVKKTRKGPFVIGRDGKFQAIAETRAEEYDLLRQVARREFAAQGIK